MRTPERATGISGRPNPKQDGDHAYVPRNMPAIGDLFDLFDFDSHH
jgi:phospholipase C